MSNRERPPVAAIESPAALSGANGAELFSKQCNAENTDDGDADQGIWSQYTVIERQPATAIYWNSANHVVVRQQPFDYHDDDVVITIDPVHLPAVIERLKEMLEQVAV